MSQPQPQPPVEDSILVLTDLTKRFGGLVAVNDATLTVRKGTIHAIIGPNGAGKSTLLNLISGIHQPDGGTMTFDGRELATEIILLPQTILGRLVSLMGTR